MSALRRVEQCKACRAPIVWAQTLAGKSMPVDASPAADGNVLLFPLADRRWLAVVMTKDEAASKSDERFKSHFATCPNASAFRGPKRAGP